MDAVATLSHIITSSIDRGHKVIEVCFLDYSDAFNCVNRSILLHELNELGVNVSLLNWLSDYFTGRSQQIVLGRNRSDSLPINNGVLQGAILSPYFFSIYIRNLPIPRNVFIFKYADDVAVLSVWTVPTTGNGQMQSALSQIGAWSSSRNLNLNPRKCKQLIFSSRNHQPSSSPCTLLLNSTPIDSSSDFSYLGVTMHTKNSWSAHVALVFQKVRRLAFYSKRLKNLRVPIAHITQFVFSCILTHWLYCSPVIFPGLLAKDFIILRRSLKCISECSGLSLSVLSEFICKKHVISSTRFAIKILSDSSHPLHDEFLACVSTSKTRNNYKPLFCRTTLYRNSCLPYLARILMSPDTIKNDLFQRLC